jgi:hypothetical protein
VRIGFPAQLFFLFFSPCSQCRGRTRGHCAWWALPLSYLPTWSIISNANWTHTAHEILGIA